MGNWQLLINFICHVKQQRIRHFTNLDLCYIKKWLMAPMEINLQFQTK